MCRLLAASLAASLCAGCGYSTRALLPSHIRSVAITSVKSLTPQPGLAEELMDSLTAAFRTDRSLKIAGSQSADLLLSVTLNGYSRQAAVYDATQVITNYEIALAAVFEAEDRIRNETFASGPASVRILYDPSRQSEETSASRALGLLSREIVRAVVTAW